VSAKRNCILPYAYGIPEGNVYGHILKVQSLETPRCFYVLTCPIEPLDVRKPTVNKRRRSVSYRRCGWKDRHSHRRAAPHNDGRVVYGQNKTHLVSRPVFTRDAL